MSHPCLRHLLTLLLIAGATSSLLVPSTRAQVTTPGNDDESPTTLEKFVVTGSNIPSAGETAANPVTVLGESDIERAGVTSDLLQVLRKTAPQFSGNSNIGIENGNISSNSTNGGAELALRNSSTLVLVNGRRVASAPVSANGGSVFVDVNAIPISAIDRIEILTDGASAIYGTDAVSGVVNIILKSDYRGAEIGSRYGFTDNDGHYSERSAWGVAGGKIGKNGPNLTASFEWSKTDPIYNYQRPFAAESFGTTEFPGLIQLGSFDETGTFQGDNNGYYLLNSSLNTPKAGATLADRGYTGPIDGGTADHIFNLSQYVTMLMKNEKKIGTLDFDQRVNNTLSLFGDLMISRTETMAALNAQGFRVALAADDPINILGTDLRVNNRIVTNPREYLANTDSYRGVFGVKGRIDQNWSWETGLDYNYIKQQFANANLIRTSAREADVATGKIDLFAINQTNVPSDLFGQADGRFASTLFNWDAKLVGTDIFALPGGGVSVALGAEYRRETLKASSDVDSQSATFAYDSGTTIDPFAAHRKVYSVFAETQIPIVGEANRLPGIYDARLILAVRHEDYSDTDNPTVPKFTLSYSPIEDLKLRATYSKSFAAPSLYQLHLPIDIGYSASLAAYDSNQANQETSAVNALSPSRSKNLSYGLVWTPKAIRELSVSLDFFQIKQDDLVSSLGTAGVIDQVFADVDASGAASQFAKYIHVGSFTGPTITTPGQIAQLGLDNIYFLIPGASNLGSQKLKGFDLKITYVLTLGNAGKLTLESSSTYYSQFDTQIVPGADYTHTAGLVTALNGTLPRWKTYSSANYQYKGFSGTVSLTYEPSLRDATWTPDFGAEGYPEREPAYTDVDAVVAYTFNGHSTWFRGLKVELGVNNIGNRLPPLSATYDGIANADIGEYSPIGRFYYADAAFKF